MKDTLKTQELPGLLLFGAIYVVAYIAGYFIAGFARSLVWQMMWFDLTATVVIWAVSLVLKNSSLYDAYWSLTPMVMVGYTAILFAENLNIYHIIFLAAFMLWSVRLTANWVITFENLMWEDWRYKQYRQLPPVLWHLANFFGIMMIPTIFVFLGILPIFFFLNSSANALSLIGSAVILLGTALEFIADRQMHSHLKSDVGKTTCRNGLWRYSRHPNYLGEILIWVGTYVAAVLTDPALWYLFGGVVAMIFLFSVISIPLAEKRHLSRRPDYADYRRETSALLLLPPKHKGDYA